MVELGTIEQHEGPQVADTKISRLSKSKRLVKGTLTGLVIRKEDLLPNRSIRAECGMHQSGADPAPLFSRVY